MIKPSLTGSGKPYVVLQARVKNGMLHVQGRGTAINREYGIADDLSVNVNNFGGIASGLKSLADTGERYFAVLGKLWDDGTLHFQIPGPERNRDYGMAFDMSPKGHKALVDFIKAELAVTKQVSSPCGGTVKAPTVEERIRLVLDKAIAEVRAILTK